MNTATETPAFFDCLYAQADTPEQLAWKRHRELLKAVPTREIGFRGCIGLAMMLSQSGIEQIITATVGRKDRLFVSDKHVRWASIVDVPLGYFHNNLNRPVRWASVRPTCQKYGVPMLAADNAKMQVDFGNFPFDPTRVSTGGRVRDMFPSTDTLQPRVQRAPFRVFNAINDAMTSTAFSFRRTWQNGRAAANKYFGLPTDSTKPALAFGPTLEETVQPAREWMPRPYLGFPSQLKDVVYDRVTRTNSALDDAPAYPAGLRDEFCADLESQLSYYAGFSGHVASVSRQRQNSGAPVLVIELVGERGELERIRYPLESVRVFKQPGSRFEQGDVIACEHFPAKLRQMPMPDQLSCTFAGRLTDSMRLWFERKAVTLLDGFTHFSAKISSLAALSSAATETMFWDITDSLRYYREDCDSLVFPTLHIRDWFELSGKLPGDIIYDLTPQDDRFEPYKQQVERVATKRKPR